MGTYVEATEIAPFNSPYSHDWHASDPLILPENQVTHVLICLYTKFSDFLSMFENFVLSVVNDPKYLLLCWPHSCRMSSFLSVSLSFLHADFLAKGPGPGKSSNGPGRRKDLVWHHNENSLGNSMHVSHNEPRRQLYPTSHDGSASSRPPDTLVSHHQRSLSHPQATLKHSSASSAFHQASGSKAASNHGSHKTPSASSAFSRAEHETRQLMKEREKELRLAQERQEQKQRERQERLERERQEVREGDCWIVVNKVACLSVWLQVLGKCMPHKHVLSKRELMHTAFVAQVGAMHSISPWLHVLIQLFPW